MRLGWRDSLDQHMDQDATETAASDEGDGLRGCGAAAARGRVPIPAPAPDSSCCACRPARCAAPTCTSSTARSSSLTPADTRPPDRRHRSSVPGDAGRHGSEGRRVGVPGSAGPAANASTAPAGRENLCPRARFTGRDIDGGWPSTRSPMRASASRIPPDYPSEQAAPLLCAGLIGYRALRMCGEPEHARASTASARPRASSPRSPLRQGIRVFAFTRSGDAAGPGVRAPTRRRVGGRLKPGSPEPLGAAIVFAPVGELVPLALRAMAPGRHGRVRRHPHERHSVLPLQRPVGGAGHPVRGEPHPRLTGRDARAGTAGAGAHPREPLSAGAGRKGAEDLREGRFTGSAVLIP